MRALLSYRSQLVALVLSLGMACGDSDASSAAPCDAPFQRDCLFHVDVALDEADFRALRKEGRSLADVYSGCAFEHTFEYTTVPARVTLAGERFEHVGVRKKGYLGSLSMRKPALRIDLAEYDADLSFHGTNVITLNNALSDPSLVRQCVAYDIFERAGVPAPRCAFANVRVNDEDLGSYVHVEAIKKPLLRR
ncbi:MAG TPA: CotH kinase family protein, partial [Polyangiales bacterium]|nr:CotH kinase family protein [Polyangiales bacterium]